MEIENQKSQLTRFEVKESDIEKLVQANENELRLTRSDNEEKQRQIDNLRQQLQESKIKLSEALANQNEMKGLHMAFKFFYIPFLKFLDSLATKVNKANKDLAESKQKLVSQNAEVLRLTNNINELETERNNSNAEIRRLQLICDEHQSRADTLAEQLAESVRKFDDYKMRSQTELELHRTDSNLVNDLSINLDESRMKLISLQNENISLREEHSMLNRKVQELQDDIEG